MHQDFVHFCCIFSAVLRAELCTTRWLPLQQIRNATRCEDGDNSTVRRKDQPILPNMPCSHSVGASQNENLTYINLPCIPYYSVMNGMNQIENGVCICVGTSALASSLCLICLHCRIQITPILEVQCSLLNLILNLLDTWVTNTRTRPG